MRNKGEWDISEFEREWISFLVPILNNRDSEIMNVRIRKILDKVKRWHIRERKQWAKGCVGDELKDYQSFSQLGVNLSFNRGYNECRANTLKKIEEE